MQVDSLSLSNPTPLLDHQNSQEYVLNTTWRYKRVVWILSGLFLILMITFGCIMVIFDFSQDPNYHSGDQQIGPKQNLAETRNTIKNFQFFQENTQQTHLSQQPNSTPSFYTPPRYFPGDKFQKWSKRETINNQHTYTTINQKGIQTMVITNSKMDYFSYNSTFLSSLMFVNNSKMVSMINSSLTNLTSLIINRTQFKQFSNLTFGKLTHLEFISSVSGLIPILDERISELTFIDNNLTSLDLSEFKYLTSLTINDSALKQLTINNPLLLSLNLSMSSLERLTIKNTLVQNMSQTVLPNLKQLYIEQSLQQFSNLSFKSLEKITFIRTNLSNLTNNSLPALLDISIIDNSIEKIELDNCSLLKNLTLTSSSMTALNFSDLRFLTNVKINISKPFFLQIRKVNLFEFQWFSNTIKEIVMQDTTIVSYGQTLYSYLENITIINGESLTGGFGLNAPELKYLSLTNFSINHLNVTLFSKAIIILNLPTLIQFTALNNFNINSFQNIFLPNLITLHMSRTNITSFNSEFTKLQSLTLQNSPIAKISIQNYANLSQIQIKNTYTQTITINNVKNLNYLIIEISYHFCDFLKISNTNIQTLENIVIPELTTILLTYVNFTKAEPLPNTYLKLITLDIFNSNIRTLNETKFPVLKYSNRIDCPNLIVITEGKELIEGKQQEKQQYEDLLRQQ